jgi:hypothetical protein
MVSGPTTGEVVIENGKIVLGGVVGGIGGFGVGVVMLKVVPALIRMILNLSGANAVIVVGTTGFGVWEGGSYVADHLAKDKVCAHLISGVELTRMGWQAY